MTNLNISPLIIGTMRLGKWGVNMTTPDLQAFIEGCLELGLNDFDHADIYGDYTEEANFGKVLKSNWILPWSERQALREPRSIGLLPTYVFQRRCCYLLRRMGHMGSTLHL